MTVIKKLKRWLADYVDGRLNEKERRNWSIILAITTFGIAWLVHPGLVDLYELTGTVWWAVGGMAGVIVGGGWNWAYGVLDRMNPSDYKPPD